MIVYGFKMAADVMATVWVTVLVFLLDYSWKLSWFAGHEAWKVKWLLIQKYKAYFSLQTFKL